jgi:prepilin-type N-terminal cleavage/methylation domain-containing protein
MSPRGFSLVELLVATAICALVSGALAGVVAPARAAFEASPAMIDLHQRTRWGIEAVSGALRGAGVAPGIPAVVPSTSSADSDVFDALWVMMPVPGGARGMVAADQSGPGGAIALATGAGCPQVGDVCGFTEGATAVIVDDLGRFDAFEVAATSPGRGEIVPDAALAIAYAAGSVVMEGETLLFETAQQPDGSRALVQRTAAGATQPIIEGVTHFVVEAWDAARRLGPSELADGPWLVGGVGVPKYDADVLGIRRIDITLAVEVLSASLRGPAGRWFGRAGTVAHTPLRWVPDRRMRVSVALRNGS